MRTDVTRQSFGAIFLQFVLFACLFFYCFMSGGGITSAGEVSVYLPGDHINRLCSACPETTLGIAAVLIFINAFIITRTVSRTLVYPTRTYLPCLFYLLVSCGIFFPAYDLAAVAASYLIIRAFVLFVSSFVRNVSFGTTFKAALFIGITPLLEPQNAPYILLVPLATVIFRRCGREVIVATLGALLPALLAGYIYWMLCYGFTGMFETIWKGLVSVGAHTLDPGSVDIAVWISAGLIVSTLLLSSFIIIVSRTDMRTRSYKVLQFSLFFLVIALGVMALPSRAAGNMTVVAIPASIIAPAFLLRFRGTVSLVLYVLICASVIAANLLPLIDL